MIFILNHSLDVSILSRCFQPIHQRQITIDISVIFYINKRVEPDCTQIALLVLFNSAGILLLQQKLNIEIIQP